MWKSLSVRLKDVSCMLVLKPVTFGDRLWDDVWQFVDTVRTSIDGKPTYVRVYRTGPVNCTGTCVGLL